MLAGTHTITPSSLSERDRESTRARERQRARTLTHQPQLKNKMSDGEQTMGVCRKTGS
jgi:hypothetical protein